MKNITFSADERLIDAARERARCQDTTLNEEFRRWLEEYVGREGQAKRAMAVIARIRSYADTGGRRFTREELNERTHAGGFGVKNITFSADERLIDAARERARSEDTTLNDEFRRWLEGYVGREAQAKRAMEVIRRMQGYVSTGGRKFTRDELNERR